MNKITIVLIIILIPFIGFTQTNPKDWNRKKHLFNKTKTNSKVSPNERKKPFQNPKRKTIFMYPEWTFDGGLGIANSYTDIGGKAWEGKDLFTDVQMRTTKWANYVNLGYRHKTRMGYGFSFNIANFSGSDVYAQGTSRTDRRNSFTNRIYEFGFNHKFYLLNNIFRNGWNYQEPTQYYVYYGLYTFINNPVLVDPSEGYRPTGKVSKFQISVPLGLGIHHTFENHLRIGFDFAYRKTFTDYLDGFTTQFSNRKDAYSTATVFVGYALSKNKYKKRTNRKPFKNKVF
jgi:hypothetical protein